MERENEKKDGNKISRFHKILSSFDVQYDSVCVVQSFHMVKLNVHFKSLEILLR